MLLLVVDRRRVSMFVIFLFLITTDIPDMDHVLNLIFFAQDSVYDRRMCEGSSVQ